MPSPLRTRFPLLVPGLVIVAAWFGGMVLLVSLLTLDPGRGTRVGAAPAPPGLDLPVSKEDRDTSRANLKRLAAAMHNHEAASLHLPPAASSGTDGKPLLSWRVALLPFLQQGELFKQFRRDEPWDSDHNKPLVEKMPAVFASPGLTAPKGHAFYKVFTGGGLFGGRTPLKVIACTDGLSNTILVAEAGEPVPWTKPEDIVYEPGKMLPKLALPNTDAVLLVATGDGAQRDVHLKNVSGPTVEAAITPAGGEVLANGWWRGNP